MTTAEDIDVWSIAANEGFSIVSKDSGFQQRALLLGPPPKVVWIRLGNCSTSDVSELLRLRVAELLEFDADPDASFLALL